MESKSLKDLSDRDLALLIDYRFVASWAQMLKEFKERQEARTVRNLTPRLEGN